MAGRLYQGPRAVRLRQTPRRTGQSCGGIWQNRIGEGNQLSNDRGNREMKTYMCVICGFVYDEAKGLPDEGIAPGTLWDDVPLNWQCPECGAGKEDFEMMEI
jgi:rubredoxin